MLPSDESRWVCRQDGTDGRTDRRTVSLCFLLDIASITTSLSTALVNTLYRARYPQCSRFQITAETLVSEYIRLLSACSSTGVLYMSMMTTLCTKAVGQLGNGIKAGRAPTYFVNRASLRQNPALYGYLSPIFFFSLEIRQQWLAKLMSMFFA